MEKQFLKKEEQIQFSEQAWHALEPHHELYGQINAHSTKAAYETQVLLLNFK